ncbi:MAG TPA: FAD-binding oxidoreductase [Candidatus Paceibacterota bacterium]
MMYQFLLEAGFEVAYDDATRATYSHDASICEIEPVCVVFPKTKHELAQLITLVNHYKKQFPTLSLTMRSRGTDMSGGSLNDSIIVDCSKYLTRIDPVKDFSITVEPGAFYKDMEIETLKSHMIMPSFTASKNLCGVGGMFANNCAGEQTLKYGKATNHILATKFIGADGIERVVSKISRGELGKLMMEDSWWGNVNRDLYDLIIHHREVIERNTPHVSKNSAGYNLWDVFNLEAGTWDVNKLLCGSQGTLGITSEITWKLSHVEDKSEMLVVFLESLDELPKAVEVIARYQPNSLESYDDTSFSLAMKYWKDFIESMGLWRAIKLTLRFIPEVVRTLRTGIPKLVLVVEMRGKDQNILREKIERMYDEIQVHGFTGRIPTSEGDREKYWAIRRESFNLLRKHLHGTRTAPFIDDTVVNVEHLPNYLRELREILDGRQLQYTIAGHAGNGNFHIIPLMDFKEKNTKEIIQEVSEQVFELVKKYNGSITGEHNDGLIRTPFLNYMFDDEMLELFKKVKHIFDPENIFNPRKKVGGSVDYTLKHIVTTS